MEHKKLNRGLRPTGRFMMLIMLALFLILFVITGVSFAMIAHNGMVRNRNLLDIALSTQFMEGTVQSRRGTIVDRNGVVIAHQHPSYRLYANLHPDWGSVVEDIEYTANRLSEVIDLTPEEVIDLLSREGVYNIEFGFAGRHLSFIEYNQILEMELPGIRFIEELTRFNPLGVFASHTIGYTMFGDEGEIIGAMGIEHFYDDILTGTDGRFSFQGDRFGFRQPGTERRYLTDPLNGHNIRLTLDSPIQVFLETAMDEVVEQADPEQIVAVVMDARTGAILAAGSRPTFDPNDRNPESYANMIMYPFEPGSTLKVFTYAAAINEGHYRGNQKFMSGSRDVHGVTISDFSRSWGEMTFDEAFYRSSNTAIIDILRNWLSFSKWVDYLDAFGFGQITGLPLPGEDSGVIPVMGTSLVDLYSSGFGQGLTVTPVQMLQATTAIINDGEMIRPQLIEEIYDPNTNTIVHQFEREVIGNPITAETARQMRELMAGVIENDVGTGRINYVLDVRSGGKTGTAQVPNLETGGYLDDVHIYNYIGFAPLEDPEIIMFVSVKNPTTKHTSGHPYAGQIYRFVMNNTLSYLGLTGPQVRAEDVVLPQFERVRTPRVFNLSTEDAVAKVEDLDLIPVVIGNGVSVFNQSPMPDTSLIIGDKVFIQTDIEDDIPNFTGWNRTQISRYAMLLELNMRIDGQGLGARQTIRAGRKVRQGDSLEIILE